MAALKRQADALRMPGNARSRSGERRVDDQPHEDYGAL